MFRRVSNLAGRHVRPTATQYPVRYFSSQKNDEENINCPMFSNFGYILLGLGVLGFGGALMANIAQAEGDKKEVEITWADELGESEMRTVQVGEKAN
jgi:hypothetical protein